MKTFLPRFIFTAAMLALMNAGPALAKDAGTPAAPSAPAPQASSSDAQTGTDGAEPQTTTDSPAGNDGKDAEAPKTISKPATPATPQEEKPNATPREADVSQEEVDANKKSDADSDKDATDADTDSDELTPENRKKELQENADKMKEKEQNVVSRLTGAAALAGGGLGGQQILSGMAEKSADEDAERDMRAYLETFRCDFGQGKNIMGGELAVETPGGNDMFDLHVEYASLAESLKTRKAALGLRAGIESEVVWDKAETGLYDNAAIGRTGGAYASVARAIMDPNGADAEAWAKQKADAADKIKKGAIVAGVGLAIGIGGNIYNEVKYGGDQSKKINEKYDGLIKITEEAQEKVDNLPQENKCAGLPGTTGNGTPPNCECADRNARFFMNQGACLTCDGDKVYNANNECVCPDNKPVDVGNNKCEAPKSECPLTGYKRPDVCECIANATKTTDNKCVCDSKNGYVEDIDENGTTTCVKEENTQPTPPQLPPLPKPEPKPERTIITELDLGSDLTFDTGKSDIKPAAKTELTSFMQKVKAEYEKAKTEGKEMNLCMEITGHTDRQGFSGVKSTKENARRNQVLSQNRANAVMEVLRTQQGALGLNIPMAATGRGWEDCPKSTYPQINTPACRHVSVKFIEGNCN